MIVAGYLLGIVLKKPTYLTLVKFPPIPTTGLKLGAASTAWASSPRLGGGMLWGQGDLVNSCDICEYLWLGLSLIKPPKDLWQSTVGPCDRRCCVNIICSTAGSWMSWWPIPRQRWVVWETNEGFDHVDLLKVAEDPCRRSTHDELMWQLVILGSMGWWDLSEAPAGEALPSARCTISNSSWQWHSQLEKSPDAGPQPRRRQFGDLLQPNSA